MRGAQVSESDSDSDGVVRKSDDAALATRSRSEDFAVMPRTCSVWIRFVSGITWNHEPATRWHHRLRPWVTGFSSVAPQLICALIDSRCWCDFAAASFVSDSVVWMWVCSRQMVAVMTLQVVAVYWWLVGFLRRWMPSLENVPKCEFLAEWSMCGGEVEIALLGFAWKIRRVDAEVGHGACRVFDLESGRSWQGFNNAASAGVW